MNYREQQLRQIHKKEVAKLQEEIVNLENSTDYQNVQDLEEEVKNQQTLFDNTLKSLGIKKSTDLQNLLNGKTLPELIKEITQLKSTKPQQKITNLENNLADTKAELKKSQEQGKSLSEIKEELESKIKNTNSQLDGLLSAISKGLIDKDWKKEVANFINNIKNTLEK